MTNCVCQVLFFSFVSRVVIDSPHNTFAFIFCLPSPLYDRKEKITQEKRKDAIDLGGLDGIV